jgi:hypothetical protein
VTTQETGSKPLPVHYSPQMADLICDKLFEGKSLREICEAPNMPGRAWRRSAAE